jgi:hypothetical protein
MSLMALQHQIDAATLATEKLESENAAKGPSTEDFPSKVRSGIRREFSAFKKVLETSKSRLQELQTMQATLDAMEDEPALHPNKSLSKQQTTKSPHWLPSLGGRKKFVFDDDSRVRSHCINGLAYYLDTWYFNKPFPV